MKVRYFLACAVGAIYLVLPNLQFLNLAIGAGGPIGPSKLYIPKLVRVVNVSDGQFTDNRWTVSRTEVSYYVSSAVPGNKGNSVFYGHNWANILGGLDKLTRGDQVYVLMASGDFVKYEVFEIFEVWPSQVEILNPSSEPRLTIYTCKGVFNEKRLVVIAKLSG